MEKQLPMSRLFYLGLVLLVVSGVFGVVTHYYSVEVPLDPQKLLIFEEEGSVSESRADVMTYRIVQVDKETVYPLSAYHFLTYVLLGLGLLIMFQNRPKLGLSFHVDRIGVLMRSKITRKLLIYLLIGMVIGLGIGYSVIPKG